MEEKAPLHVIHSPTLRAGFEPFDFAQGKLREKSLLTLIKVEIGWQQVEYHVMFNDVKHAE